MKHLNLLIVMLLTLPAVALATSFDCNKATSRVEKLICSNKKLSKADDALDGDYKNMLSITAADKKPDLITEQRMWISKVRNTCQDEQCLDLVYNIRSFYFRKVTNGADEADSSGAFTLVTEPKEIAYVINDFQTSLNQIGMSGHIQHCPIIVAIPLYRATIYGVICDIRMKEKQRPLMMCADTMVGHFAINGGDFAFDTDDVKKFLKANCFAGG